MAPLALPAASVTTRFRAFGIRLPPAVPPAPRGLVLVEWDVLRSGPPQSTSGSQQASTFHLSIGSPAALFLPASEDPCDRANQQAMDLELAAFVDTICAAIERAFRLWQSAARLVEVQIEGAVASGGRLEGPGLECILQAMPSLRHLSPWGRRLGEGIAGGFASAWSGFCRSVSVPGLPWYPEFAAFRGPWAPPTPNRPTPFSMLAQEASLVSPAQLEAAMVRRTQGNTPHADAVLCAVAESLAAALERWRTTQVVTHVFGSGRVPTYDPPAVTTGPVAAGEGTMTPGGLASDHP